MLSAATLLSDLTPILYARPSTISGVNELSIVIDVVELNSVATSGVFTVKITKDSRLSLNFPANARVVNNQPVQNSVWQFSASHPSYYVLTIRQSVPAGDWLSFGLIGTLNPIATSGALAISSILLSTEIREAK